MSNEAKEPVTAGRAQGINYKEYHMSLGERLLYFFVAMAVVAVVAYVFYERWYVSLFAGIIGGLIYVPMRKQQIIDKRKQQLTLQFKELLESVKSSLGSMTAYDSFMKARSDLAVQYADDAYIMQELALIMQGAMLKERLEDMLEELGERSEIEDIQNFALAFKSSIVQGGDLQDVVSKCIGIINEKIEVSMEIETMVAGQKNEQSILLVLPIVFVVMLKAMGGMVDLNSSLGLISMTIAIVIFVAAYFISVKITKIDV